MILVTNLNFSLNKNSKIILKSFISLSNNLVGLFTKTNEMVNTFAFQQQKNEEICIIKCKT